jgi:hypothetical protein
MQLREIAGSLMSALYWAEKNKLDPKECWDRWPVNISGILAGYDKLPMYEDVTSIDSRLSPVIPELRPICNILRCQAVYHVRKLKNKGEIREYAEYEKRDLTALKAAFNLEADDVWAGLRESKDRPPYLMLNSCSTLRILAEMLLHFTFLLTTDSGVDGKRTVHGLHEHNPIAVCSHCDGLYLRTRADGEYCSVKCRSAAWSQSKGKKYFAQKQRESRAAKAKQREAKRNRKK